MKRDEDVWISRGTKASRPDELGPDQGSGVADSLTGKTGDEEGSEPSANSDILGAWCPGSSDGNGGLPPPHSHPPSMPATPRSVTQGPCDWTEQQGRRPSEWVLGRKTLASFPFRGQETRLPSGASGFGFACGLSSL